MAFFSADNNDHRRLADAYCNGDCDKLPQEQVVRVAQDFMQNAPDHEVRQVEQEYFQQMPQHQRAGLFEGLLNLVGGERAQKQAGVTTLNPRQASSLDLSNLFQFALNSGLLNNLLGGLQNRNGQPSQNNTGFLGSLLGLLGGNQPQQPYMDDRSAYPSNSQQQRQGGLQALLGNPMVQSALSGLMGFAANKALGSLQNQSGQTSQNQPNQPPQQPRFPDNGQIV